MARLEIISNLLIADRTYILKLRVDKSIPFVAGQFAHVGVPYQEGILLKRPLSVQSVIDDEMSIIYEIRGKGTEVLAGITCGELDVLYYQGNGFPVVAGDKKIMLIGGGIGVPPLFSVAEQYKDREFYSFMGFRSKDKVILEKEFQAVGELVITTDDGSYGEKGFAVMQAISLIHKIKPDVIFACGPKPMLKALTNVQDNVKIFVSMEERMGCGYGACLVCTCKTIAGNKRVCMDGPVFDIKELEL